MQRGQFRSSDQFLWGSEWSGNEIVLGIRGDELRAVVLVPAAFFAIWMIFVVAVLGGSMNWNLERIVAIFAPVAVLCFAILALVWAISVWDRTTISLDGGSIRTRRGAFLVTFETEGSIAAAESVAFWIDGLPTRSRNGMLCSFLMIELRMPEAATSVPLARVYAPAWSPLDHVELASALGLPISVPGSPFRPKRIATAADLKGATAKAARDPESGPSIEAQMRARRTNDGAGVEFAYAPFDLINAPFNHVFVGIFFAALLPLIDQLLAEGASTFEGRKAFYFSMLLIFSLLTLLAPPLLASRMRRRIELRDGVLTSSVKIEKSRPKVAISEIVGLCEGRQTTWASHVKGTWGLWALTQEACVPLAIGMDEPTYLAVSDAVKRMLRDAR